MGDGSLLPVCLEYRRTKTCPLGVSAAQMIVVAFDYFLSISNTCCCGSDVIGIVKGVEDLRELKSKQGRDLKKRDVLLVDESQVQIRLTLWADDVSCSAVISCCSLWSIH